MKITTLNLQAIKDWELRKPAILEYLQATDSDVILFQEVVYLSDISPYNQVQLLNQTLKYPYIHSSVTRLQESFTYKTYREGLAMLSKFPLLSSDTFVLKKDSRDEHNRIVQFVDLQVGDQVVKLANIHLSITDFYDLATPQLEEILQVVSSRGEKRIIVGDFNISDLDATSGLWKDEYRASTEKEYITFPEEDKRIDYFLIPKNCSFGDVSVSDRVLTDHFAVTAEVEVNI